MYENILLPIALDHEKDTRHAVDIARRLGGDGATLTFIHVVERMPGYLAGQLPEDVVQSVRDEAKNELAAMAKEAGANTAFALLEGSPGQVIVDYAEEKKVDCIVVSSHKPGLSDYFLGSTAARVVRHAPCAVHVIR